MRAIGEAVPAGAGYVRSVFSRRGQGQAVPLDLLRAHLRCVVKAAARRRVSAAFAGYLVTEPEPEPAAVWSQARAAHDWGVDAYCSTSDRQAVGLGRHCLGALMAGGPLDAPCLLAAGGMVRDSLGLDFGGIGEVVDRERAVAEVPFSGRRWWYQHESPWVTGCDVSWAWVWCDWAKEGNWGALDAPEVMAAGGMYGCESKHRSRIALTVRRGAA